LTRNINIIKRGDQTPLFFLKFNSASIGFEDDNLLFDNLDQTIEYSRLLIIKGRVGRGKSTLLKAIADIIPLVSGEIVNQDINGEDINSIYIHPSAEFNFVTGYVKDELILSGIDIDSIDAEFLDRSIYDMSGGELKRLSVLMALADNRYKIILLDEPLDMLDDIYSDIISKQIIESSKDKAMIIATHDTHFDSAADIIIEIT